MKKYESETIIAASPAQVWDALVNPTKVKQYMYGSEIVSDWQVGKPIEWYIPSDKGPQLVVKGTITDIEAERTLANTLLPITPTVPDEPKNYIQVRYTLVPVNEGTRLQIVQDGFEGIADEEKRYQDTLTGWAQVLPNLKAVAEAG